jgi:hypothetical protein
VALAHPAISEHGVCLHPSPSHLKQAWYVAFARVNAVEPLSDVEAEVALAHPPSAKAQVIAMIVKVRMVLMVAVAVLD